jgi:ATP-dependent protease ClpP protease subunit
MTPIVLIQKLSVTFALAVSFCNLVMAQVVFEGAITQESIDAFLEKNRDFQGTSIKLMSHGGDGLAAMKLADWILRKELDVVVDTICYSACANYLFLAGKKKTIAPGAILMWHGGMQRKDIRDSQNKFREIEAVVVTKGLSALTNEDRDFFNLWSTRFAITNLMQAKELLFLNQVGVNEYLFRLGQEPFLYQPDCWGASEKLLQHFGVKNLSFDASYTQTKRFSMNRLAMSLCRSTPQFFDLTSDGKIANIAN